MDKRMSKQIMLNPSTKIIPGVAKVKL